MWLNVHSAQTVANAFTCFDFCKRQSKRLHRNKIYKHRNKKADNGRTFPTLTGVKMYNRFQKVKQKQTNYNHF